MNDWLKKAAGLTKEQNMVRSTRVRKFGEFPGRPRNEEEEICNYIKKYKVSNM